MVIELTKLLSFANLIGRYFGKSAMLKIPYCMKKTTLFAWYFIVLFFFAGNAFSRQVPGFIITHNADTINGLIKVSKVSLMNRAVNVNGIDLETFHYMVSFKENGQKHFKTYQVNDIKGFNFRYKDVTYKFQQFELRSNTFVSGDQVRSRFLCEIVKGEVTLYKDITRRQTGVDQQHLYKNYQGAVYYEYYLYNKELGLAKVIKSNSSESLLDLLLQYGVDDEYLQLISPQTKYKDVKEVLIDYENWKAAQAPVIYNS